MRCEQCGMGEDRHTSDCPIRLAAKNRLVSASDQIVNDLTAWRTDPDVRLIIDATCRHHDVLTMAELPGDVIVDMHEAIGVLMEESPTLTHPGDPRRMM